MAEAMGRFEGLYKKGSRAQRNHNPVNIRKWGNLPQDKDGYTIFPDVVAGWAAADAQIARNIERNLTLYTFFAGERDERGEIIDGGYPGFAPAADKNKPSEYAAFVASFVKKAFGWTLERDKPLSKQIRG